MADQVEEFSVDNKPLLENAFSVNSVKEEECQNDITIDNAELQGPLICDKMKLHDVSITLDNIKTELSLSEIQSNMIQDNLKIEEGISADSLKTEFNNRLLYCEDCHAYRENYCTECEMLVQILNKTVLANADNTSQDELPTENIIKIQDNLGQFQIFALKVLPVGVRFGPFTGLNIAERPWQIKDGRITVNQNKSKCLNWMQYINSAKNISEQNLLVFQYEDNVYYQSTRQIQAGDELLVYFGEEYEDSLVGNIEIDFIPTSEHIFKEAFACIFCCLGFSSKSYLAKHKTICPTNVNGEFSIEELAQCPSCKIILDQKEYITHHMPYCCKTNDRKCILPTTGNERAPVCGRKTRQQQIYTCQQCKYRTKYKGDLTKHTNRHYAVKTYKCEFCCRRFKTEEVLRLHVENTHVRADDNEDWEPSIGDYMKVHIKTEGSCSQDDIEQFKCSFCEFQAKDKLNLKRHLAVAHLKEFKYNCGTCEYKTNWKSNLNKHIASKHLKVCKYKCDTCNYKSNRAWDLKAHIETKHLKEFKYKCAACDYETNFRCFLKSHVEARHSKQFKYKCGACDFKAKWKSQLQAHIKTRHLKEFKYKCDLCDYKTNVKYHLMKHVEGIHLKAFKYACDVCDYKSNWNSDLKSHIETNHLRMFKHKCDTCDYKTNIKSHLKAHFKARHLKEFNYKCDTCDYKTNRKTDLKVHINTKHLKEYKYKCDVCDYKTNKKFDLEIHIKTKHLNEFKYNCDACDYKTNQKSNLGRHIEAKHLQEFKYKCDRCDYKTNNKSDLGIHIKTKHLNEFKYNCDKCDYKTNQKSNLSRHIEAKHLKVSYNCDICDYKASRKFDLKKHMEGKHSTACNYKCGTCDYKTTYKSALEKHIKAKHL